MVYLTDISEMSSEYYHEYNAFIWKCLDFVMYSVSYHIVQFYVLTCVGWMIESDFFSYETQTF